MHLTESYDDDIPRLITNVETTSATTPDDNMVEVVHRSLGGRNLLPAEHLVDKGYTDARVLVNSKREHGVEIIGPLRRTQAGKPGIRPASIRQHLPTIGRAKWSLVPQAREASPGCQVVL